jgi:heavy metal translocating P-type ATPase
MKRVIRFIRDYHYFSLALVALFISCVFQASGQHNIVKWVLAIVSVLEIFPMLWKSWQNFRSGGYGINILAPAAIVTAIILDKGWTAIVVVLMFTGSTIIENHITTKTQRELDLLTKRMPKRAQIVHKGKVSEVSVSALHVGDKIGIKDGQVIPVDGTVIEGTGSFDESALTGSTQIFEKHINDQVLSGSVNVNGTLLIKATATSDDSQYQQMVKQLRGASAQKAPFVKLATRYSIPFTFAAFAIGGTVWALSDHALRFLEVIVVASPYPLLACAPIAIMSGMSRSSRYGIIFKTGSAFEKLADAETMMINKSGTLTTGRPAVVAVEAFDPYLKEDIISLAASLEQNSKHAVAQAIVNEAAIQQIKITKSKHANEIIGRGMVAIIKGKQVLVGKLSLFEDEEIAITEKLKTDISTHGSIYVGIDHALAGIITVTDELRGESKASIALMRKLGLNQIIMVTGDSMTTAEAIAHELGITKIQANLIAPEKLRLIDENKARPLVYVGDGLHDAPTLTAADVGVALGVKGMPLAGESADVVILLDSVGYVAIAYQIAKRTLRIAQQSVYGGVLASLALMLVFATGTIQPVYGALAIEVVNIVVLINAFRAHRGKLVSL